MKATKGFIEKELAKYGSWEDFLASPRIGQVQIANAKSFSNIKRDGVGIETIHAFLGGQWKRHYIQDTLSVIRQEEDAERRRDVRPCCALTQDMACTCTMTQNAAQAILAQNGQSQM